MADTTNHYISIENLNKRIVNINIINDTNQTVEEKISNKLSEIKSTIKIDGKTLNNKKESIESTMTRYTENYMGCANSFKAIIGRYETAVDDGASHIKTQLGE